MLSTILFSLILVLDSFMTSITYGANGIKVPKRSIIIISFIGTLFLSFSLLFASGIKHYISPFFASFISFLLLFLLGLSNLFHFIVKTKKKKVFSFNFKEIHFVIDIYFDELKADMDHSSSLSVKEAIFLAIALSFDSLLSGFGFGLSDIPISFFLTFTFILNIIVFKIGLWIGKRIQNNHYDFSWLTALIFFILAFSKLIS